MSVLNTVPHNMFFVIFIYAAVTVRPVIADENFILQLTTGKIQGREFNSTYSPFGNQTGHIYFGIPYAKPPLGDLRFRKTVPVERWDGILETKEYKPACMSRAMKYIIDKRGLISEDCLYLNVFTNDFCMTNKNCSVMLVVHGGAYVLGSATTFDPQIIINNFVGQNRNIIVVTVDYRLGVFGFGHLNGEYGDSADHNVALCDLIESLKWTKREISNFGGMPNRVTVFGQSAGATIVFHLTTSPLTRGLIHQQIIMSGPIPAHSKIGNTKSTRAIAIRVGCLAENSTIGKMTKEQVKNIENGQTTVNSCNKEGKECTIGLTLLTQEVASTSTFNQTFECLRSLDAETLLAGQLYITYNTTTGIGAPYVDGEIVPDYPDLVLKTGNFQKINTLIGALSAELRETLYVQDADGNVIDNRLKQICSHLGWRIAFSNPIAFEEKCQKEYQKKNMAQYLTDDMEFYSQTINIANANLEENTSIYVYHYAYSGAGLAFRRYLQNQISPMHSEDLIYVFGTHRVNMQPKDYMIEKIYSGIFADFVSRSDPSPSEFQKWKPYSKSEREYFTIDFDESFKMPGMSKGYAERANRIWNVEIPIIAGPIHHMERFPPSFDTLICSTLTAAMESHYTGISIDMQRSLEVVEQGYFEMELFLKQLKMEYLIGNLTSQDRTVLEMKSEEQSVGTSDTFNIILIASVTVVLVIMLFITITRWLLSRKRSGYQLLKTGKIQGRELNATYSPFGNQTAHVYLGIPYAKPPLGNLRFRRTVPVEKWNGIRETKEYKPACLSNAPRTYKNTEGGPISEDCLHLNVFTNDFCMKNKNCSVMIVVHGGSFVAESASAFNPEIMINNFVGQNRNIIVVTVNYRLGIFGFGHLNGEYGGSADHNVAIQDLVESLKWTHREIENFGGRADRITVAGHSAGATAVFYLVSSPLSKGLVYQQILMSAPMSVNTKIGNTKATRATAIQAGCLDQNSPVGKLTKEEVKNTFDCLRKLDGKTLIEAQLTVYSNTSTSFGPPHVDGEVIVDYADNLLSSGKIHKVHTLVGTVSAELRETLYCQDAEGNAHDKLVKNFCSHLGWRATFKDPITFEEECSKLYSKKHLAQFISDDKEFYSAAINIANSHLSEITNVYVYSYSYVGAGNAFDKYMPTVPSPTHSEDLIYVFGTHRKTMLPKDYVIEKIYSGVFADFVNNGDPSPSETQKWRRYTKDQRDYFHIDFDEKFEMPGMKTKYYERAHQFWNVEMNKLAGPVHHMERFPPSFDVILCSIVATAIDSHVQQVSTDRDRPLEVVEIGYYENENFLEQLKMEYVNGNITYEDESTPQINLKSGIRLKMKRDIVLRSSEETETTRPLNIFLLVSAAILMLVMLYVAVTRWCISRKRNGYQMLR